MKKHFSAFHFINLPENTSGNSLLFAPNHFSWWDGFFIDETVRVLYPHHKLYLMMLEEQLNRYKFFRKVGAFSINPGNVRSSLESIRYAAEKLQQPEIAMVIYPQGEIQPFDSEDISLKKGIESVLKLSPQTLIQILGYKIQYENEKLPALYCRFGKLLNYGETKDFMPEFTQLFSENLRLLTGSANNKESVKRIF